MAHVLLSFARGDADLAERVGRWLSAERHTVMFQSDPGATKADTGVEAVHRADLLFCIVTPSFATSPRCMAVAGMAAWAGVGVFVLRTGAGEAPPPPWPLTDTIDPDGEVVDEPADDTDDPDDQEALREQIVAGLRRWDVSGRWTRDDPPYPGLRPFDAGMAQVFFGRDEDSRKLTERLRAPAGPAGAGLTIIVGPSGSGKSSLVRAGAIPLLQADPAWLVCPPLTPGVDPGATLGQVLTHVARTRDGAWTRDGIERILAEPDGLARLAKQLLAGGTEQRMLLVLDQIEELFTRTSPSAREKFLALLAAAAPGPVQVVATLRSEFLDDMLTAAGEAELPVGTFTLTALRPEALRAVVTGPARLAGVRVDEPLVDRLVADAGSGQALPLLAFVLEQLAQGVGDGGELSEKRYGELGGVSGALAAQADAALGAAQTRTGRSRADVLAGLLRLVTVDDAGNTTRRSVGLDGLPEAVRIELGEFVDRRLLTTDDSVDGPVVAVAHERVLTAWPPLAEAIGRENDVLRLRRTAEAAAAEWERRGRPADHLWPLGRATTANGILKSADLIPNVRAFLATSTSQGRRRRQQYIALLAVLSVTVIGVAFALVQAQVASRGRDRAEAARRQAVAGQLLARAYSARSSDPGAAFRLAAVAETVLPGSGPEAALMDLLVNSGVDASLRGHVGPVWSVAFAPDGRTLATGSADETVLLWDLTDRTTPRRLGDSLTSHNGPVESMAFAPDGRTLATGSSDGTVVLWDVSDRATPRRLGGPLTSGEDSVGSLAFSPNGRTLATGRDDRTVLLWDVTNRTDPRKLVSLTGYNDSVASVAFSPDGRTLATGSDDRTVRLWDVSNPAAPRPLGNPLTSHHSSVWSVVFSPDGRTLATGSDDQTVRLWDVSNPAEPRPLGSPLTSRNGPVLSVAFAPDGSTLATSSSDGTVLLWDVSNRTAPRQFAGSLAGHNDPVRSVAFSPDGRTLATGSDDRTVLLWDVSTPAAPRQLGGSLTGHSDPVRSVAFSPDGRTLATGSDDRTVLLWDVSTPAAPHRLGGSLTGHSDPVRSVAFSPDGHTLATGSDDRTVLLWDVSTPAAPHRLGDPLTGPNGPVGSVAFSPDGHTLAAGSDDRTVLLWDVSNPAAPRQLGGSLAGHSDPVRSVAFSPDGHTLATGSDDRTVRLWDVSNPAAARPLGDPLPSHDSSVWSVAFAPDGRTLAAGSDDKTVLLWDVADRTGPRQLGDPLTGPSGPVRSVAFAPDGRTLAAGSDDQTVLLWDVSDRSTARQLGDPLTGPNGAVWSVAFSPDGRTLAAGSDDQTVLLWDVSDPAASRRLGDPLTGPNGAVWSVVFSPDGRTLAAGSDDRTVMLWDLADRASPGRLGAPLTGHSDPVRSVAFAPDGRTLATGSDDRTVMLWDLAELQRIRRDLVGEACRRAGGVTEQEWSRYIPDLPFRRICR